MRHSRTEVTRTKEPRSARQGENPHRVIRARALLLCKSHQFLDHLKFFRHQFDQGLHALFAITHHKAVNHKGAAKYMPLKPAPAPCMLKNPNGSMPLVLVQRFAVSQPGKARCNVANIPTWYSMLNLAESGATLRATGYVRRR